MKLILFGPPGVGKGTQAKMLSSEFGVPHISTGDLLRHTVAEGTALGNKAKSFMDAGQLVPDDLIIGIFRDVMSAPRTQKGFVLDGFPRTLPQAKALTDLFSELKMDDYRVVNFDVDDEVIVRRLGHRLMCPRDGKIYNIEIDPVERNGHCPECGTPLVERMDDKADTVRKRLIVYHRQTEPVLAFFEALGVVLRVDGMGTIDVVNREIKVLLRDEVC
jgi:adenylate kinase